MVRYFSRNNREFSAKGLEFFREIRVESAFGPVCVVRNLYFTLLTNFWAVKGPFLNQNNKSLTVQFSGSIKEF